MANFSIFTLITTQIIVSLVTISMYYAIRKNNVISKYGIYFILMPLLACLLKLLLPLESIHSFTVDLTPVIGPMHRFYVSSYGDYLVSDIIKGIWLIGITVAFLFLVRDIRTTQALAREGLAIEKTSSIKKVLSDIQVELDYHKKIKVIKCYGISTPFIFGYFSPTIFVPVINYSEKELYYVLKHEIVHWLQHDTWIKLFMQMLCIIYWWNPLIYLLRNLVSHSLEIKCDTQVCKTLSEEEKLDYLNTMVHTIKNFAKPPAINDSLVTANFAKRSNDIIQRFQLVYDYNHTDKKVLVPIILSVMLFIGAFAITFQPAYEPTYEDYLDPDGSGIPITAETSYIVEENNEHYLYVLDESPFKLTKNEFEEYMEAGIPMKNKE